MGALKDLELLVRSRYPVIAVDTPEEDRLERALEQVAENLRSPLFVWSVTVGLRRASTPNVIYDTKAIGQALANLGEMNGDAIVYFKDLLRYLGQPEVMRKILDLAPRFSAERRTMVLTATTTELPRELQKVAATFTLELPTAAELRRLAERVLADLSRRNTITMQMGPADFERLVERLKGFRRTSTSSSASRRSCWARTACSSTRPRRRTWPPSAASGGSRRGSPSARRRSRPRRSSSGSTRRRGCSCSA